MVMELGGKKGKEERGRGEKEGRGVREERGGGEEGRGR